MAALVTGSTTLGTQQTLHTTTRNLILSICDTFHPECKLKPLLQPYQVHLLFFLLSKPTGAGHLESAPDRHVGQFIMACDRCDLGVGVYIVHTCSDCMIGKAIEDYTTTTVCVVCAVSCQCCCQVGSSCWQKIAESCTWI